MVLVHGGAASTYRGVTYLIHTDSTIPQRCVFSKTYVPSCSLLCANLVTMLESLETANGIVDHVTIFPAFFTLAVYSVKVRASTFMKNAITIVLGYLNYRVSFLSFSLMLNSLFKWIRILSITLAIIRRSSCRRRLGILNSLLFLSQPQHTSLAAQASQEASAAPYKAGAPFYTVLSSWPVKQTASFKISRAQNWTLILLCSGPCLICWVTWP